MPAADSPEEPRSARAFDEVQDATRRTRLASERTYLAWWRTGLTAFAVSLGSGRLVPAIAGGRGGRGGPPGGGPGGVVPTRPSRVTVGGAVPQLREGVPEHEPVYVGGPVQPTSVVLLAEFLDPAPAGLLVLGRIGFPAADA